MIIDQSVYPDVEHLAPVQQRLGIPYWKAADLREGSVDLCEDMV